MGMKKSIFIIPLFFLSILFTHVVCQTPSFAVIGYYAGGPAQLDSFQIEKLTHIIFSFCHLKGNRLNVNNARDTLTIQKMVDLKKRNPGLKVLLSLGGWGVREGALAAGFTLVGASTEAGVATSILFGLSGPLAGIIVELMAPLERRRQARRKAR